MGEIKYSSAPYAVWSEDMLRKKLDDIVNNTEDLDIYLEEDFFNACLFKLCWPYRGVGFAYKWKIFKLK